MKPITKILIYLCIVILGISCKNNNPAGKIASQKQMVKNINLSIFIDLSDRLNPDLDDKIPSQADRDLAIIGELVEVFKKNMQRVDGIRTKANFQVFFKPEPEFSGINQIADSLKIDLALGKNKAYIFNNISNRVDTNIQEVYKLAVEADSYPGSDIWRFFRNDVKPLCIRDTALFRNILVIFTDGYIYHQSSALVNGNRSSYLTSSYLRQLGFPRISNWEEEFNNGDYGLITEVEDIYGLEVLVCEVTPNTQNPNEELVIRKYLSKWFDEMGIKKYLILNSDIPSNTIPRIRSFFN